MLAWLPAALFSLFAFGLWGFFSKLTVLHIDAKSALVFQTIGVAISGLITLSLIHFKPETNPRGISLALLTGLAYGFGCLFYFFAVSRGKVMTVVTLTALYPLITILLSLFLLGEKIHFTQWVGIILAVIAILFMSA